MDVQELVTGLKILLSKCTLDSERIDTIIEEVLYGVRDYQETKDETVSPEVLTLSEILHTLCCRKIHPDDINPIEIFDGGICLYYSPNDKKDKDKWLDLAKSLIAIVGINNIELIVAAKDRLNEKDPISIVTALVLMSHIVEVEELKDLCDSLLYLFLEPCVQCHETSKEPCQSSDSEPQQIASDTQELQLFFEGFLSPTSQNKEDNLDIPLVEVVSPDQI